MSEKAIRKNANRVMLDAAKDQLDISRALDSVDPALFVKSLSDSFEMRSELLRSIGVEITTTPSEALPAQMHMVALFQAGTEHITVGVRNAIDFYEAYKADKEKRND